MASNYVYFDQGAGSVPQGVAASVGAGAVDTGTQRVTLATGGFFTSILANVYTALTQSLRIEEIDPISQHYVAETLIDVTDTADATYDLYIDMAGYSKSAFQIDLNCGLGTVVATMYGTTQDDGTAPAGCDFQNLNADLYGVANLTAAAGAAADMWIDDTGATGLMKYLWLEIVANTGGAGAQLADITVYHKRMF